LLGRPRHRGQRPCSRTLGRGRRPGGRGAGGPEAAEHVHDGNGEHQGTGEDVHVEEVRPAVGTGQRQREVHKRELQTRNTQQGEPRQKYYPNF